MNSVNPPLISRVSMYPHITRVYAYFAGKLNAIIPFLNLYQGMHDDDDNLVED